MSDPVPEANIPTATMNDQEPANNIPTHAASTPHAAINSRSSSKSNGNGKSGSNGRLRQLCCCMSCILLLGLIGIVIWYMVIFTEDDPEPMASCGDCHCIVDDSVSSVNGTTATTRTCPSTENRRTNFTKDEIDAWSSQTALNPYTLTNDCNPYNSADNCETSPSQDEDLLSLGDTAACAIHLEHQLAGDNVTQICESAEYQLKTYASLKEAESNGGFVTHMGHCGVCSTMQDLAAYLKATDLTTQGKFCAKQGAFSVESGLTCYLDLGMTEPCAQMWAHNSWNTAKECFTECVLKDGVSYLNTEQPNNGPAPECALNDCLQCDEDHSGALFSQIAGRTRRRSGLLSGIARPCDELAPIAQEPCPETTSLLEI